MTTPPKDLLVGAFDAALGACDPLKIMAAHLPPRPRGKTLVVGAGKAAASMARAVHEAWGADSPVDGLVITRHAHGYDDKTLTGGIEVVEAGHPVPDNHGEDAARQIAERVAALGPDDLLLCLISGGGSSLLSLPALGLSMDDLKAANRSLLKSGAAIDDMNRVRKHISAIQGGRLAASTKARVLALIISDVPGDEPTHIASGPCSPDDSTYQAALDIIARYGMDMPDAVMAHLQKGAAGDIDETPKPGDAAFARTEVKVISKSQDSLAAAADYFQQNGITPVILGDTIEGEAREVAKVMAAIARQVRTHDTPWAPPVALISGGETTVTVRGSGRGGRNAEFLLGLAIALDGMAGVHAIACDSDGIDGSEDNAGALLAPDSLARARDKGINPQALLDNNDGYGFFETLGDLIVTGPTRTNVNDVRVLLIV